MEPIELRSSVWEGNNLVTRARLLKDDGSLLTSTDCPTFKVYIYGRGSGQAPIFTQPATAASAVLLTALATSGWTDDSVGYNAQHVLNTTQALMSGGESYRVVFEFNTSTTASVFVVHNVAVRSRMGSTI